MDKALKQRLVGAVVLIALAVIVLPMIFGGRPDSTGPEARTIELPAEPPDLEFETRRFPVGPDSPHGDDEGAAEVEPGAESTAHIQTLPRPNDPPVMPTDSQRGPEDGPADSGEPPADTAQDTTARDADPDAAGERMDALVASLTDEAPAGDATRYVVQVASFGHRDNAVRLAGRLEESGYAVLLDNVSSETGALNRVRVGPYGTESRAQEVAARLSEEIEGVNPRVVDMNPDAAGPSLASDDPLLRWVVQVGSFSSRENARDLVARLREAGLSAFDETVSTETSTIYRVRVGPYLDRDEALATERSIANDMGIDGVVMSSD